jgi:hypothetical protein
MSTVVNETETEVTASEAFEIYAAVFAKRKKLPNIEYTFAPMGEMLLYTVEKPILRMSPPRLKVWVVAYRWSIGGLGILTNDQCRLEILTESKGIFPRFSLPSIRLIMEGGIKSLWGTYTLEVRGSAPTLEVSPKGELTIIKNGTYVLRYGVTSFKAEESGVQK